MDDNVEQESLWQGRGWVMFTDDSVVELFNWPENPPTMTVVDKDGNEVELA